MEKTRKKIQHDGENQIFFRRMTVTIFLYIVAYSILFFFLEARLIALLLLVGVLLFNSAIIILERLNLPNSARMVLVVSGYYYIYTTHVGIRADLNADNYYLVALMLPVMLFDPAQKIRIGIWMLLCPIVWALDLWGPLPELSSYWIPETFPSGAFKIVNFLGALALAGFFLKHFVDRFHQSNLDLALTSQRQNYILEGAGLGSWDWWLQTNQVSYDRRWCEMLGLIYEKTPQDRSTWESLIHPEDEQKISEDLRRHLENDSGTYENIHRLRHANGSWVWILDRGRVSERDADGKPIRFTGTHLDITHYREAEELSSNLQKMAKIGGWEFNVATQERTWTEETYRIHELPIGTHPSHVSGLSFIHPNDQLRFSVSMAQCLEGRPFFDVFAFVDAKGRNKWVEVMGESIPNSNGGVTKVRGTIQDVTEQKRARENLEKKSKELEEAQKVAKLGSWMFNVGTGEVRWSKQLFEIFHEDPTQGAPCFEKHCSSIHPEDLEGFLKVVDQCVKTGKSFRIRYRGHFSTEAVWVESIGHAKVDATGNVYELSGTCQDITELVQAEEEAKIERAKAMHNSKLASLGEMSAGIAHEINNPLAIVSGNASILIRFLADPEKLQAKIDTILRASDRISKIVNGLKKFSRTSGKGAHKPHAICDMSREAFILTEIKANTNATPVLIDCQTEANIDCDEIEVEQVLVNLISNGIDAVKGLDEKWVGVKIFEDGDEVVVRVTDSGKGIDPEVGRKLFEPFFTTKSIGEGTGLGLSIVKGILDEHQATIEIMSVEGNTCFEIRFRKSKTH